MRAIKIYLSCKPCTTDGQHFAPVPSLKVVQVPPSAGHMLTVQVRSVQPNATLERSPFALFDEDTGRSDVCNTVGCADRVSTMRYSRKAVQQPPPLLAHSIAGFSSAMPM